MGDWISNDEQALGAWKHNGQRRYGNPFLSFSAYLIVSLGVSDWHVRCVVTSGERRKKVRGGGADGVDKATGCAMMISSEKQVELTKGGERQRRCECKTIICVCVCMCACVHVYMFVFMYVCVHVCTSVCVCFCSHASLSLGDVSAVFVRIKRVQEDSHRGIHICVYFSMFPRNNNVSERNILLMLADVCV